MKDTFEKKAELGQVWTPNDIAVRMARLAVSFCDAPPKLVVDPACGPATFSKAMYSIIKSDVKYISYDIDERWAAYTRKFFDSAEIRGDVLVKDYLRDWKKKLSADLLIMNPPYIRQEKIKDIDKDFYLKKVGQEFGFQLDRRSNLFVYFFAKALRDVRAGGIICAIVYDALDNTRYGVKALDLIHRHCEVLHQERIKTPFENTLIDATIVVLKVRAIPLDGVQASFTHLEKGFARLGELVDVRRGLGLAHRSAFEASTQDSYYEYSKIFISKQRKIEGLSFKSCDVQERAYLFEDEADIPRQLQKELKRRLESVGAKDFRFTHRVASSPIIFNYYIRNHPRHLLNVSKIPASDNFYLITPKFLSNKATWLLLNTTHYLNCLLSAARSQGNGLKKLQLYEYKEAVVPDWRLLSSKEIIQLNKTAERLCRINTTAGTVIRKSADELLSSFDLGRAMHAKAVA